MGGKGEIFKTMILLIIVLSGCSNKYVTAREEGLIGREWSVLDAEILGRYNIGLILNLSVKDFVEVKDSVKLARLYKSSRRRIGTYKVFGGCAIAASATFASFNSAFAWLNDPSEDIFLTLAWCYGIVGGVGALYFISSGLADFSKSDRAKPHYILKRI